MKCRITLIRYHIIGCKGMKHSWHQQDHQGKIRKVEYLGRLRAKLMRMIKYSTVNQSFNHTQDYFQRLTKRDWKSSELWVKYRGHLRMGQPIREMLSWKILSIITNATMMLLLYPGLSLHYLINQSWLLQIHLSPICQHQSSLIKGHLYLIKALTILLKVRIVKLLIPSSITPCKQVM